MTIQDLKTEIFRWKLTKYKIVNLSIGFCALLIYEFFARPIYRPYIYSNNINDFHIADTLGNSLGTVATIFIFLGLLSQEKKQGYFLIKIITIGVIVFELAHPLLGKPIDLWDIVATILTGLLSFGFFHILNNKYK